MELSTESWSMMAAIGRSLSGVDKGSGVAGISWLVGGKGIGGGDGGLEGAQQELMDKIAITTSARHSNFSAGWLINFD